MEPRSLSLVDASIQDLLNALETRAISSVELVTLYLHRIGKFDYRGPRLNSICVLNPNALDEAQASDDYRASGKARRLEGIPFTVKDSFKVKGLTVAAGSLALQHLQASDDAAVVTFLREAGAIVIGKTNMPAMADGGWRRGLYGRAESPYNLKYCPTAYASGSSYGCGTATTASFAAFGLAGETVSSGRAPASASALVGYSPSRGIIPARGQWPLYPTCDVIVPHTRSMEDLFEVLNVLVQDDQNYERGGDFWARQPFVKIPKPSEIRPQDYRVLRDAGPLQGKRVGVPRCMLGHTDARPTSILSASVRELWDRARLLLERLGAEVMETDFPLLQKYTAAEFPGQSSNVPGVSTEFTSIERCDMIARGWDDFLRQNGDKNFPNLTTVNPNHLTPQIAPMDDPSEHYEAQNQVRYQDMIDTVRGRTGTETLYDFHGCQKAAESLEAMRVREFHDWMDEKKFDVLAFPTQGDVPFADADESHASMRHALQDGVKYANGGRALKHLGVPCITVPMGNMRDKQMPVGLTFASKAYADNDLLRYAFAYEQKSRERVSPPLTPDLSTDKIVLTDRYGNTSPREKPELTITSTEATKVDRAGVEERSILLTGTVSSSSPLVQITAFANGERLQGLIVEDSAWTLRARHSSLKVSERYPTLAPVPRDQLMIVIHAKAPNGRSAAKMVMIE